MKVIGVLVLLAGLGVGVYFMFIQKVDVPELTLMGTDGQSVTTGQLRGDAEAILTVFLLPNCPLSKFSAKMVSEQMKNTSGAVAFVGLVFTDKTQAAKLQQEWGLAFPCYGLRDAPDPLAANALIEAVGSSHGMRNAIIGGTILLIDDNNKLLFKLEKDEVKELATRLADAGF